MVEQAKEAPDLMEVFAYFGRTAYMANVLEVALAQTLLQVEFMTNLRATVLKNQGKDFDRARYENEFDEYYEKELGTTMGQLVKKVEGFPDQNDEMKQRIKDALARRNHLTHNYWREQAYTFQTAKGRAIAELSKDKYCMKTRFIAVFRAILVPRPIGISQHCIPSGWRNGHVLSFLRCSGIADSMGAT